MAQSISFKLKLIRLFTDKKMAIVFAMGFASGLPLLLTLTTLQAWLSEAKVNLTQIGLMTLIGLPYTVKFLWAPALDRLIPPFLGRRRGWMAITQIGLILSLVGISLCDPTVSLTGIWIFSFLIATLSATQDIAIDAYRREIMSMESFGFGNSLYITGYRIGMLAAGAGALILADQMPWSQVYQIMAVVMSLGLVVTFLCPEPTIDHPPPRTLRETLIDPFADFFQKSGVLWVLAFILLYKVGDNMASAITIPFYKQLGFSNTAIGAISKVFGIWATIAGGLIGGTAMAFLGMRSSLWIFGIFQAATTLGFAWLNLVVPPGAEDSFSTVALAIVIGCENLASGMGTAAYTTFMASLTNTRFTATQYALLASLMGVPRVIIAAPSGWLAETMGWNGFFIFCTLCAVPGLLLLLKLGKHTDTAQSTTNKEVSETQTPSTSNGTGNALQT